METGNPGDYSQEMRMTQTIGDIRKKNRRKRLENLFGESVDIDDIVKAVGEKEVQEEIKKLESHKNELDEEKLQRMSIKELEDEIKKVKEEFDVVVKEMFEMREKSAATGAVECDNLAIMLKDIIGHNAKLENDCQHYTEELEKAKQEERELREKIYIAKNEKDAEMVKKNGGTWEALRNGNALGSIADMKKHQK